MRIHRHRRGQPKYNLPQYKINDQIKAPEVRLVHEGNSDTIPIHEAIAKAREAGLDLIEISPKAKPPVCKIMDHSNFKYQKEKEAKKQRAQSKEVEIKGIRLSFRIGTSDIEVRRKQAKNFFEKGHKIKIEMQLRGREREHKQRAQDIINNFIDLLKEDYEVRIESPVTYQGNRFNAVIAREK